MKKTFKHLQLFSIGVFLLMSTAAFAAKNECYSDAELKDFKTLYIKLQNELNYEGKDAYLDKNFQVQLKPHAKDAPYPGKEFEAALFGEYQNSLRKVGKLYQDAKYEGDDNFKSNDLLVNFMKAIDDKSNASDDFINKTKIKDVINALEEASKKKYAKSADKKFIITDGDKYLLEKLLTHAQDRVCSVSKYEQTSKGTTLFKADYLQKIKNAPLNVLVNTIKNAPIEKDSKIDLKPASDLTADLVDPNIAIKSAITDNLNQLSAWVKKVKSKGSACLAAIKTKSFANNIQGNIQGCNFGHFMDTLGQDNVNNLESVLHFINANERLLNQAVAKAETNLDEMKFEGFIGKTFENLGTEVKCTLVDSANAGDKKVFVRNLPYNEKENKFDTSGIVCKTSSKLLGADSCKKQFDLVSDSLGRGLEIKPKNNVDSSLVFSINEAKSCAAIAVKDLKSSSSTNSSGSTNTVASEEMCMAQSKDGAAFTWNPKVSKCSEVSLSSVGSIEQCMALKKSGKVFNWDLEKKSCGEFSSLISGAALKQSEQMCEVKKREGFSFKWNTSDKACDQSTTLSSSEVKSLEACEAKAKDGFKWNISNKACDQLLVLSTSEQKSALACEAKSKDGFSFKWNNSNKACDELPILSASEQKSALACEAKSKDGFSFKWNNSNKACDELPILSASEQKSALACEAKSKDGFSFKWNNSNKTCDELPILSATEQKSALACEAKSKNGSSFKWNTSSKACDELPILSASEQKSALACEAKTKNGSSFKWNNFNKACDEIPTLSANEQKSKDFCEAKSTNGISSRWDFQNKKCLEGAAALSGLSVNEKQAKLACESKQNPGMAFKWNMSNKVCDELPITSSNQQQSLGLSDNLGNSNNSAISGNTNNSGLAANEKQAKIACEVKSSPGISYKWNSTNQSCSRSPASSSATTGIDGSKSQTGATNAIGGVDKSDLSGSGSGNSSGNTGSKSQAKPIVLTNGSSATQSNNDQTAAQTFAQGTQPSLTSSSLTGATNTTGSSSLSGSSASNTSGTQKANDTGAKSDITSATKSQLNSNSSTGPKVGSSSTTSQGSTNTSGQSQQANSGQKPITSSGSSSDSSTPTLNESSKTLSSEQIKCESNKKESMAFVWMFEEKECVELPVGDAKLKCEEQRRIGFAYRWLEDTLKCEEKSVDEAQLDCAQSEKEGREYKWAGSAVKCAPPVKTESTKETCEAQKKDGIVFTWDADKKSCTEAAAQSAEDKLEEDLKAKEAACEKKNSDWVEKFNDGRPDFKYRWEDSQCKDVGKKDSKTSKKGEKEEAIEALEAPSAPKRAPARFTPINIPSRQIYLMPGMP